MRTAEIETKRRGVLRSLAVVPAALLALLPSAH